MLAQVLLTALVLLRLGMLRNAAVRAKDVSLRYYRSFSEGEEPQYLQVASNCLKNQFELPVLFYLLSIIAYITEHVDRSLLVLCWAFAFSRYWHAGVYLSSNAVLQRFRVFLFGFVLLVLAWLLLSIRLISEYRS